ncbi:MAG TPA: hypothetical protein VFJ58_23285 [Armatimonadota bacterium]|nr:hypothetical protein [Armatimonadota bacterium]
MSAPQSTQIRPAVQTADGITEQAAIQKRYHDALGALVSKLKQDQQILAAILCGSLSYDEVWIKSDIDLLLIAREGKYPVRSYCLVEDDINIHALIYTRSKFKQSLEGSLQSSFFHSFFSRSTLLFTQDETLKDYYDDVRRVGSRDRDLQLLSESGGAIATLAKAEKWLYIKKDAVYSFLWIMHTVGCLASMEVALHGEVAGREVIQQALKLNPSFFNAVYTDLAQQEKNETSLRNALDLINQYLDERTPILFKPILEFLSAAGGSRSTTELDDYFGKQVQSESLAIAYEWLAEKGIIRKIPAPLRLTEKSRVQVNEAAYYYDGDDH